MRRRYHTLLLQGGLPADSTRVNRKQSGPKHRIQLMSDGKFWRWKYYVGKTEKANSPRSYLRLSDASYSARLFRGLLANADICEIVPPKDHKYSGG